MRGYVISLETKKTACTMPGQLTPGDTIYSAGKQGRSRVNHKQHRGLGLYPGGCEPAKRSHHMKSIINTFLAITICAGLLLAGSEADNLATQMLASIGGVMLFAAGCLGICKLNREE
jgi:hypothetical protein